MMTADLPALPPGAGRIPFASASARQVAQALTYATERLAARFPGLDWTTWSDTFRDVNPDLVVQGPVVWLEGSVLEHLVQRLAASPASPVPDPPVFRPAAAEPLEQCTTTTTQDLARQDLVQLEETPGVGSPPLEELVVTLAQDEATAARVDAATHEPADEAPWPDPLVFGPQPGSTTPDAVAVDVPVAGTPPAPAANPAPPAPAPERSLATTRRTFGDIVQQHPRANGKVGFTVRELCRAMRISAASLREAHANPGRLSLRAVRALASLMQEPFLSVLADLLAGAGTSKKRRNRGDARQVGWEQELGN